MENKQDILKQLADSDMEVVKSAIEHGYFGADAYIDNRTDTLVVRGAAPQPKKPAPAPVPKAHPAAEDEYAALLRDQIIELRGQK